MRRAILSDIHANLEALQAVVADIQAADDIDEVICLGDIVGYGPNPCECIELIMECDIVILGNHDQAVLFDPLNFNQAAERAIFWTRGQLEKFADEQMWEFLGELPQSYRDGPYLYVHGSACNPLNEYVFPEDVRQPRKMERLFAKVENYCFQGHTHIPGVFTDQFCFFTPSELEYAYQLDDHKVMINVGSVGQPRDGDPRACYVVITDNVVQFRRLEYDVETTIAKMLDIPELENYLAERLRNGR